MCEYVSVRVAAAILCLVVCCISSVFFSSAVFVYLFSFFSLPSLSSLDVAELSNSD